MLWLEFNEYYDETAVLSNDRQMHSLNDPLFINFQTVNDIDYINESITMYNGLSGEAPNNRSTEEIRNLADYLYVQ